MPYWLRKIYTKIYQWLYKIEKQNFDEEWMFRNFKRIPVLPEHTLEVIITNYNKGNLSKETAFVLECYEAFVNDC